jgi:ribosomal protein S18 acetylase RimI-like enzyme
MPSRPSDLKILDHGREDLPEATVDALVALRKARQAELRPEDPPLPTAIHVADVRTPDVAGRRSRWLVAWRGAQAVGYAETNIDQHDNPDIVWLWVYVSPDRRRQGIGRALAVQALEEAQGALDPSPTQIGFDIAISSDVGGELRARIEDDWGLSVAIMGRRARLDLATVNRAAIEEARARRLASIGDRYRLLFFENLDVPGPETGFDIEDFCTTYEEIMNLMPLEDLQLDRERFPPERFLALVGWLKKTGRRMWYLVCSEPNGHVVGLTAICFPDADHRKVEQWDTGVLAEAQGNGIGSLLKLDMLLRIMDQLPNTRFIDTDNAGSNAPMIAINTALGFYEHWINYVYQLPIETLRELLGEAP